MIAWNNYKDEAKQRGSLAMEVYVIESRPSGDVDAVKQHLPAHLAYQAKLESSGQLMFAGPLSSDCGEWMEGTGMILYRAKSLGAATELAQQDPMHINGARSFTIRRWLINEGSLQIDIKLSEQKISLDPTQ
ncbi:hypothetical protein DBZ36_17050 [Alginatibacterium sediminis]|uniref:YCII-related domain-containing protein n=1 Tax=Alginatibacterium sediminis TaxID=2164068 RepID=A0A420E869_9ALTE|nr:YciI family protein [Alginatibacterium sediminis]RKF14363.1 hypothetical protein DBZ36_17050 [Alginatibacterium sediminis]